MSDGAEPEVPAVKPPTLETHRLILRQYEPADAEAILKACQDPDIQRCLYHSTPHCLAHVEAIYMKFAANGWQDNSRYGFGVFARDDGRLVRAQCLTTRPAFLVVGSFASSNIAIPLPLSMCDLVGHCH
jgi:RimJ/RimL family protein N-acetyltransferase